MVIGFTTTIHGQWQLAYIPLRGLGASSSFTFLPLKAMAATLPLLFNGAKLAAEALPVEDTGHGEPHGERGPHTYDA